MSSPEQLGTGARAALAASAALALADASIVTLGLPSILIELDATVTGRALPARSRPPHLRDPVLRRTRDMSRKVRDVPRIVPVTFERPCRGTYRTGTS